MSLSDQNVRTMQPLSESGLPVTGYSAIKSYLVNRAMDAARAEGEAAGVQKAEHAAADHIAMLESRLLAAIWAIPGDHRVRVLQREAERIQAARTSMKVQLEAAEMELGHAIDRANRAEVEVKWFGALQDTLDAWAATSGNGPMIFRTAMGDMRFPRQPATASEPLHFTPPTDADASARSPLTALARKAGEIADFTERGSAVQQLADIVSRLAFEVEPR